MVRPATARGPVGPGQSLPTGEGKAKAGGLGKVLKSWVCLKEEFEYYPENSDETWEVSGELM